MTVFFLFFCFKKYKIFDSIYSTDDYKSSKISIGAITKNREMLRSVPDHLKTKTKCKHEVKKLLFIIRYVPDWYKTQQMCDKTVLENGGTLKFVLYHFKIQEICDKAVDNYTV